MLDGRLRYFEYLEDRLKPVERATRSGIAGLLLSVFLLAVMLIGSWIVKGPWFDIPAPVQDYLWESAPWRFNVNDFRQLCMSNGLTTNLTTVLLFIYCSSCGVGLLASVIMALVAWLTVRALRRRRKIGRNRHLFYRVMRLLAALNELSCAPGSSSNKRQASRLVRSMDLYASVSPLRRDWRSDSVYRWFDQNALNNTTIRMLAALRSFREKALYCLRNDHDISRLADAIDELATFLYVVSLQGQMEYLPPRPEPSPEEAAGALTRFANTLNRIQIRREERAPLAGKVKERVRGVLESRYAQSVAAIALVAALTITLGAVLFRIPASTAFLAWVSIVFGSTLLGVALQIPDIRRPDN